MASRVNKVGCIQQLAALVALVPPRIVVPTAGGGTLPLHKTVGQEPLAGLAVGLGGGDTTKVNVSIGMSFPAAGLGDGDTARV